MTPGFYVVRMVHRGMGNRLIVESRPFKKVAWIEAEDPGHARRRADSWRDFVQDEHPKDDVFVIEREGPMDERPRRG